MSITEAVKKDSFDEYIGEIRSICGIGRTLKFPLRSKL